MPELPEVETIARRLRPVLTDHTVEDVDVLWSRTIDRPSLDAFLVQLRGARFTGIHRRGKYIVMDLDRPWTLLVHLRMSGKFAVHGPDEGPGDDKHTRVVMRLDDGTWVTYVDQRKFGRFYLVKNSDEIVNGLGLEPFSPEFSAGWLQGALSGRRGEIKRLLLDQRFLAGLGNIYVSESLWLARIHPARVAGSLTAEECRRLHGAIIEVLRQSIGNGGTSLEDRQYVYPDGEIGNHQVHLKVYDRADDACPRCGYALERFVQGQRSTYFCPVCQPLDPQTAPG